MLTLGGDQYYLLWGDTSIRITSTTNPVSWPDPGQVLLSPRPGMFDSDLVESGPPPLKLSTGDWLFIHNSADGNHTYHPCVQPTPLRCPSQSGVVLYC